MRFGEQFEYHKIPEWYNNYLNYESLKKKIELFKEKQKAGDYMKLPGLYLFLKETGKIATFDLYNDDDLSSLMNSNELS